MTTSIEVQPQSILCASPGGSNFNMMYGNGGNGGGMG